MLRAELVRRGLPMRREMKEILFALAKDDKRNGNTKGHPHGSLLYKQCRVNCDLDTRERSLATSWYHCLVNEHW